MTTSQTILQSVTASCCSGRRYIPVVGDIVIGVIVVKTADNFKVDIGSPAHAILSNIAFNAASKRHRPNLKVGQAVICHVTAADKHLDTELSCEDPTSQKDWVTNEVYFGALPEGGLMVETPLPLSCRLMAKNCPIFGLLGQYLKPFEVAVGANGRVYIKTGEQEHLRAVLVGEVISRCESMPLDEVETLCQEQERRLKQ